VSGIQQHPAARWDVGKIADALRASQGVVAVAARALGVNRKVLYDYFHRHPELQEVLDDCREVSVDLAEAALINMVSDPDHKDHYKAVAYRLGCHGRARGYSSRPAAHVEVHLGLALEDVAALAAAVSARLDARSIPVIDVGEDDDP